VVVSSGSPREGLHVVIAHPETLTRCEPNQVGEIWVAGSSVAQGYWNRSEQTEQTFRAYLSDTGEGSFLRTGDLGFLEGNNLFVTGRLKDLIIIRGRNYYPQDIELTVETSHSALQTGCGAAFAVEIEGEEYLVIVQEVERSYIRKLDVEQVTGAIRKAVAEQHELQSHAILLLKTSSIPKTSSGKIQRHACKVGFLEDSLNVIGSWKSAVINAKESELWDTEENAIQSPSHKQLTLTFNPSNSSPDEIAESIQNWIKNWLSLKLKIDTRTIYSNQSFAEYGLDSVMAVELAEDLQSWLNPDQAFLEATIVWSFPTIEALAWYLANELRTTSSTSHTESELKVFSSVKGFGASTSLVQVEPEISPEHVRQLSEDEVSALIAKEVAELESLLREV
jgi:acyl carrier protein